MGDEALERDQDARLGTTNIDFSVALEREMARTRSYRPIHLTVGSESIQVRSSESVVVERKIDLPDTWVRGLVEVQSALAFTPIELTLSAGAVATAEPTSAGAAACASVPSPARTARSAHAVPCLLSFAPPRVV